MHYSGKIEYADARKMRQSNTRLYRVLHTPLWIWVFFLAPGPLTFSLFAHGFSLWNAVWLAVVIIGVFIAGYFGQLPGCEPRPYILRFDEDRPNPLYRRVCYTFAWNAVINFALLNLAGLVIAAFKGQWVLKQVYEFAYSPICAVILLLGILGPLPRVGASTKREGIERRYFYGSVWSVAIAQTVLLILWKVLPASPDVAVIKLVAFAGVLCLMGLASWQGMLPRTRPILPGEIIAD